MNLIIGSQPRPEAARRVPPETVLERAPGRATTEAYKLLAQHYASVHIRPCTSVAALPYLERSDLRAKTQRVRSDSDSELTPVDFRPRS